MGDRTSLGGHVAVTPPLNRHGVAYLNRFADSRRMLRTNGPYHLDPDDDTASAWPADVIDGDTPPDGQPGLDCGWAPTSDGSAIESIGNVNSDSPEWMAYLIHTFLKPGAVLARQLRARREGTAPPEHARWSFPPEFDHFTFDHHLDGAIDAHGEDPGDEWRVVVRDNLVAVQSGAITFADEIPIHLDPVPSP